jgi:hypothetical protein
MKNMLLNVPNILCILKNCSLYQANRTISGKPEYAGAETHGRVETERRAEGSSHREDCSSNI